MVAVTVHSDVAAAAAKSLQSCPTLCDPIKGSPPGSPVPGILQAKIFFLGSKSLQTVTATMKLKDPCSLEENLLQIYEVY